MLRHVDPLKNYVLGRRLHGRVFISGTGRAGTTLLVQLLTALGLNTGFQTAAAGDADHGDGEGSYFDIARAGFERDPFRPENPFVVKTPFLCDQLDDVLASGIEISHLIIPVRRLEEAAESRRYVQRQTTGRPDGAAVAGGLWGTNDARSQESVLAEKFIRLVEAGARNDIPMTFLAFPRFTRDAGYTFNQLRFLLPMMRFETFRAIFDSCVKPELVHDFRQQETALAEETGNN